MPGLGTCYAIKGSVGPPKGHLFQFPVILCEQIYFLLSSTQDFYNDVGIVPVMMMRRSTTVRLRLHGVSCACLSASFGALEHAEPVCCGSLVARCFIPRTQPQQEPPKRPNLGRQATDPQTPAQTKHRGHGRMRQERGQGRKSHVMIRKGTMIDTETDTVKDVG